MTPLERAINIAGNQTALATALGVEPMTVSNWKKRCTSCSVVSIYLVTGVTPHEIRPDIHPTPTSGIPEICKVAVFLLKD